MAELSFSTTMVRGFAAATAEISASWLSGRLRVVVSASSCP
jgi:hypothetical protein